MTTNKSLLVSPRRKLVFTLVRARSVGGAADDLFANAFGWTVPTGYAQTELALVCSTSQSTWIATQVQGGAELQESTQSGLTSVNTTFTKLLR
jgi:hypothetical protein